MGRERPLKVRRLPCQAVRQLRYRLAQWSATRERREQEASVSRSGHQRQPGTRRCAERSGASCVESQEFAVAAKNTRQRRQSLESIGWRQVAGGGAAREHAATIGTPSPRCVTGPSRSASIGGGTGASSPVTVPVVGSHVLLIRALRVLTCVL